MTRCMGGNGYPGLAAMDAAGTSHKENHDSMITPMPKAVSFQEITRILELTDQLELDRERIEIPLTPASPGNIHKLPNGKIEIVVDADIPFDDWLATAEQQIRQVAGL